MDGETCYSNVFFPAKVKVKILAARKSDYL